jgi:hypothetical protein
MVPAESPGKPTILLMEVKNNTLYRSAVISGILLMIAALSRCFSLNNLLIAISTGDISRHFAASVLIDGAFSSLLLFLVGAWILFLSAELRKLQRRARSQAILIGVSLVLFGAGFWYRYPRSLHLVFFFGVGLLLLLPLFIYKKQFRK